MNERFTELPMCFYVEDELLESKLRINLFQIEGYVETSYPFRDDDDLPVEYDGVKIFTKSGFEYDILMPVKEFEKLFK